jgi:hypothetical protein
MKISTALFMSCSLFGLALPMAPMAPMAYAGDEPLAPDLPHGYDLMTLSRGPAKVVPGLEPLKNMNETATILSVGPTSGESAGTRIEWSGYVQTGVVYKNTRTR